MYWTYVRPCGLQHDQGFTPGLEEKFTLTLMSVPQVEKRLEVIENASNLEQAMEKTKATSEPHISLLPLLTL